jgi:UDP-N-acetyl-D-mannosaminuronate dehydrogenase
MKKRNVIIMGAGEIGTAMKGICDDYKHNTFVVERDYVDKNIPKKSTMLVNIPYNDSFIFNVEEAARKYQPESIIINSTTNIGTTRTIENLINKPTIHSPVRGIHPMLKEGIKTFVKYIGATDRKYAEGAARFFNDMDIQTAIFNSPEETEMTKLLETTTYGVYIAWATEVAKMCAEAGLDFDHVYTQANKTYNEGYQKLGFPQFTRPLLKPCEGKFGGHCVGPNIKILGKKIGKFKDILDDLI